jgi:type VI secretion system protein ImpH
MERVRARDRTLVGFLDLFNHRMVSLFYQAWEKYRFTIAYERGERDRFSHHLLDLIGLGTKGLAERQAVPDDSLLFYAGLLSLHTRSASALKYILEDYFDIPVEVEQFVGAWYFLDIPNQCCMENANTISEQLGYGAVVGDEIWDQQSGVRLCLGPLTFRQYIDFLPEGSAYEPLRSITRFFAGQELDFEVKLILKRLEVPECELDDTLVDRGEVTPQLGWTSWIKTRPMGRDPGDCVLRQN